MSLSKLQEKIGVTVDGVFGPGTLKAAMEYYEFTPERAAHFFAQTAHESSNFKTFSENLKVICLDADLNTLPEFSSKYYHPNGCTGLYDAIGNSIKLKENDTNNR